MAIWTSALMLYLILDPFGNTPVVITLLQDVPPRRRKWVILREHLIALAVLLFFMFLGRPFLDLLDIRGPELEIAGGVVIFLISLRMIFPYHGALMGDDELEGEPLVVPLAVPLLAGPSAIAVVMLFTSAQPTKIAQREAIAAVVLAWSAALATSLISQQLARVLSRRGLVAIERLMGMVLCVIAVHMLLAGLEHYLSGL